MSKLKQINQIIEYLGSPTKIKLLSLLLENNTISYPKLLEQCDASTNTVKATLDIWESDKLITIQGTKRRRIVTIDTNHLVYQAFEGFIGILKIDEQLAQMKGENEWEKRYDVMQLFRTLSNFRISFFEFREKWAKYFSFSEKIINRKA